jgi:uncharacterized protein involved in response to NO
MFATGETLPSRFAPLDWHIHAMLFGFVPAAIAGFLLTAIPNWTGRPPVHGRTLAILAGLWLAGRVVAFLSALMPLWLAALIDLSFLFALAGVAAREIISARNWRNAAIPLPVCVLGIANLLMYLELGGVGLPVGLGWRLGLAAIIILMSVIGGRIIPNFTRNWLMRQRQSALPPAPGLIDRAALGTLLLGLIGWAFLPATQVVGVLLLLAGLLNLWRVARWRGIATLGEPLLAILHIGYFWLAAGAALLGAAMLSYAVPQAAAIHALTAGAIGTMILAVMTRVTRGHTGRPLEADRTTVWIYALVSLSALVRVIAAFSAAWIMPLLETSALLWIAAFLLFTLVYGPYLLQPRTS